MRKTLGVILMMPLLLIMLGSLGAAIYALVTKIYDIGTSPVIILSIAIILYIIGLVLVLKKGVKNVSNNI